MLKKFLIVIVCGIFCITSQLSVYASEQMGSLHFNLKDSNATATVEVYRVADYENGNYVLSEDFSKYMNAKEIQEFENLSVKKTSAADVEKSARTLSKVAEDKNLISYYAGNVTDALVLYDLPQGMYMVVGTLSNGDEILPSLIGVPYWDEEHNLIFDVVAFAKLGAGPGPEIPETPENPEKPDGTDTGVQSHAKTYAILLTVSSLGLFLLLGKKKHEA